MPGAPLLEHDISSFTSFVNLLHFIPIPTISDGLKATLIIVKWKYCQHLSGIDIHFLFRFVETAEISVDG